MSGRPIREDHLNFDCAIFTAHLTPLALTPSISCFPLDTPRQKMDRSLNVGKANQRCQPPHYLNRMTTVA